MAYGTVSADVIQSSVANTSLGAGNASIMKNRILNGACVIDQRNAGASVTPTAGAGYTLDRWQYQVTQSSKITFQQNAGSVTPPVGFTKYLGSTIASSATVSASDYFVIDQGIEGLNIADLGWGTANAKTITISFQVYSSLTGTFGGCIRNGGGTRSYPFTYSIPVANTWTSISVTIAGDTTGTWATDNTSGILVYIGLGVGSTYSGTAGAWAGANYLGATGATSLVSTNGATFYITGVQLEVGSSATGFEYRQYQQELALCQRYYQSWGGVANSWQIQGYNTAGSNTAQSFTLPVTMRSAPTYTLSGTPTYSNSSGFNIGTVTSGATYGLFMYVSTTATGTFYVTSSTAVIQLSSEL
jgi:hypothetical protein